MRSVRSPAVGASGPPVLLAALLACLIGASAAAAYKCDCASRNNCMCPSLAAPGGMDPSDIPQFVLLTHDDAILPTTDKAYRQVCDGRRNPNGSPYRATMFTQQVNTDCKLAKKMWEDGYEIATHTANHVMMKAGYPWADTVEEIMGAKRFLADECGIPAHTIRGFRSPYLMTNPLVRQALFENGFLFDSTLLETGQSESLSKSFGERVWPYTMDFGIAQNVAWFETQVVNATERWPGLWEVPLWVLQAFGLEWSMDVGYHGGRGVYEPLKATFDEAYNGNRAPLPIFLHTTWVEKDPDRVKELERFADYTATKGDVFWVTYSQLIEWMLDPKPASQMRELGGRPAAPTPPPSLPATGANVTLSLPGATPQQVRDQADRLAAAVAQLLGPGASSPFVAEAAGGPSDGMAPDAAGESTFSVQSVSVPVGRPASGPGLPKDGFMQFEGLTYGPEESFSIQSSAGGSSVDARSMPGAPVAPPLSVTLAVAGADPLALHQHAADPTRQEALAGELRAMGFNPAGQPAVVPFESGVALQLDGPAAPSPAAQAEPEVQAAAAPAPAPVPAPATPADTASLPSPSPVASTSGDTSSASTSSGLSTGAIVGVAVATAAVVAAAIAGAVVYRRCQRSSGARCASAAGSAEEAAKELEAGVDSPVSIAVRAS